MKKYLTIAIAVLTVVLVICAVVGLVGLTALLILQADGISVFEEPTVPAYQRPEEAAPTEPEVTTQTKPLIEKPAEPITEPATEPPTEPTVEETTNAETEPATEGPTEAETEPATEPPTTPATKPESDSDKELLEILERNDLDLQKLKEKNCTQLITVSSSGNTARFRFYTLENGKWKINEALTCNGFVGRRGVTDSKREGDGCTPVGLYSISDAFYINQAPQTGLDMFEITKDTYWVDDPNSKYYNKRVEGTENKDWNSAEHMINYNPAYEYGFVIDYNVEAVYNAGSAIFFHVTATGTSGCVGTGRQMVINYLALLDKDCNPHILIE